MLEIVTNVPEKNKLVTNDAHRFHQVANYNLS